jgi:hypothetical protein
MPSTEIQEHVKQERVVNHRVVIAFILLVLLAGNTIPIGWVGTAGPTMTYGSKDNNTRNGDISQKDRFKSYER